MWGTGGPHVPKKRIKITSGVILGEPPLGQIRDFVLVRPRTACLILRIQQGDHRVDISQLYTLQEPLRLPDNQYEEN